MSKIGEKPITVAPGVSVEVRGQVVHIKAATGEYSYELPAGIAAEIVGETLLIKAPGRGKRTKALHGLWRSIIANILTGTTTPWEKALEVVGTGYNVKLEGEGLVFKVGYSHPVIFKKVDGISFSVAGNNKITVKGVDRQLVGQVAQRIKAIKKPDPYKGKGIKYEGEKLRIKPGKRAKAAGATA